MNEILFPLILFALAGCVSPGPNNVMVTASGQAFGFRRSLPHMAGVTIGFAVMVAALGLGLVEIFRLYPDLHHVFRILGAIYLLYLASRLALAGDPQTQEEMRKPLTFFEAALFQWINPKAWTLAIGVIPAFTRVGGNLMAELALIIAVFMLTTILSLSLWCAFGVVIRHFLSSPRQRRVVNYAMAGLVALSVAMLFV